MIKEILFTVRNPKVIKGEKKGYQTFILHLAPEKSAGSGNICPWASPGCVAACLNTAGRGGIFKKGESTNTIQEARKRKTRMFMNDRREFLTLLESEIRRAVKKAERKGLIPVFRLNGTSDLKWENFDIIQKFPEVQFYDYTKSIDRILDADLPYNYHLTFSRSELNDALAERALRVGRNVAVVFHGGLPDTWRGFRVVNGDESDLRFLDDRGVVVGLKAKGRGKKDESGFVVEAAELVTA